MINRLLAVGALLLALATPITIAQASDVEAIWDFSHPKESEARFRVELSHADAMGDASEGGELRSQIARAQAMQDDFAGATTVLDALRDDLPHLSPAVSIRYMLERGRLIQAQGNTHRAWRWYHAALLSAQRTQLDFFAIDAMHMLALTTSGQAALDWNLKAVALAEHSSTANVDDWLGSLYNNIGWLYHDLKDDAKALTYLRRAQSWHEAHGSDQPLLIARWSVAKLLRLNGEPDKALPIQLDLERAWSKRGTQDGYVYEEIAEDMSALGQTDEARHYFGKAYAALAKDSWIAQRDPNHLARLKQMAQ